MIGLSWNTRIIVVLHGKKHDLEVYRGSADLLGILNVLTLIFLGIPVFVFGTYGAVLLRFGLSKKKESHEKDDLFEPSVSIVVPTHNEEMIIAKKIENILSLDYPKEKLEVIFVDDSNDSTPKIIDEHSRNSAYIHLIRFDQRIGYSPSMIAGCQAAKNEIIVYAEAGSFMDRRAIRNLVRHFRDPGIGLVTGRSIIMNVKDEIGQVEKSYLQMADFLRMAESQMDSTFWVKGEATAVRAELIKDLDNCHATFDNTSALFVRQKGYKAIFDPDVKFYEFAPKTYKDWSKQKTIRAANWMKMLLRFKSMFFKQRYGLFGCLTLPMQFSMLVVVPITLLLGVACLTVLTFFDFAFALPIWVMLLCLLLISFILNRKIPATFLEFEYVLLKALYQVAFTRTEHDKIDKAASTRTGVHTQ
jgi:cellulose synthase/poly-beta-1,6-N-acetylglucosamine synthase-like glycosyltransferase